MRASLLFCLLLGHFVVSAQDQQLTAAQILDKSIQFCGQHEAKARMAMTYALFLPDSSKAIVDEKRIHGEQYSQSIMSPDHISQTHFFNGKRWTKVNGNSIIHVDNLEHIEEVKLKSYLNLQVGYKALNYKLERLEDKKFINFDCYVLSAKSENGYATLNFFDKSNFRLLMVMYPNGNKSLMIDYERRDSVLINTHIVNTFAQSKDQQVLKLMKYQSNAKFSDVWFSCPYDTTVQIPAHIKTGNFQSTNGPDTWFERTESYQQYHDKDGKPIGKTYLRWINNDSIMLIPEEAIENNDNGTYVLVRIVSWDARGYVCQWLSGPYTDTQDYQLIDKY